MGADLGLQHRIEQLLFREADCLDRRDWDGWEALFAPDGMYWVPLGHDQADPLNHASLFFEDSIMRDVRRRRLDQVHAWSQHPVTYAARIVGNVRIVAGTDDAPTLRVRSTFQMTEWRRGSDLRQLAGHYTHDLVAIDEAWRIALKRVDLINCDGAHE